MKQDTGKGRGRRSTRLKSNIVSYEGGVRGSGRGRASERSWLAFCITVLRVQVPEWLSSTRGPGEW